MPWVCISPTRASPGHFPNDSGTQKAPCRNGILFAMRAHVRVMLWRIYRDDLMLWRSSRLWWRLEGTSVLSVLRGLHIMLLVAPRGDFCLAGVPRVALPASGGASGGFRSCWCFTGRSEFRCCVGKSHLIFWCVKGQACIRRDVTGGEQWRRQWPENS